MARDSARLPAMTRVRKRGSLLASITLVAFLASALQPAVAWADAPAPRSEAKSKVDLLPAAPPAERPPASPHQRPSTASATADGAVLTATATAPSSALPPAKPLALPKGDDAVSGQAIALPSGGATVGGMGESFSAQLTTGIATLSVPFAMPAARGSAQPALGLVYSSSGGYGLAGVGWSLVGQVFIARQTDRSVPGYNDGSDWQPEQDRFVFGSHELVPICTVSSGTCSGALAGEAFPAWSNGWQYFRPRVEGAFLRFFWSPDHKTWRVQSKDGNNLELGAPLDGTGYTGALEANPTRPNEIYRWHLVRQYDPRGAPDALPNPAPVNIVAYRYFHDAGVAYLSDVFHTPPASNPSTTDLTTFAHHARLVYESRPDFSSSYRAGFSQEQRLRLVRVDVASKPFANAIASPRELVRRYHLAYDSTTHASLLLSVQMEGRCASATLEVSDGSLPPTACPRLPPLSFEYQRVQGPGAALTDTQGHAFEKLNETLVPVPGSPPHSLDESETTLLDVNADSLPDVLVTAPGLFNGKHGLFLNGNGGALGFASAVGMTVTGISDVDTGVLRLGNPNVAGLDLDGDARADLVHMPKVKKYSAFTPELAGTQWTWKGRPITTASGQSPKIDFTSDADRIAVMDVDSDGLVDVVFSSATEVQTFFALGRYPGGDGRFGSAVRTGPETATLSEDPVTACAPWSATVVRFGDDDVRVADMNGDGLPDIVRVRAGQALYWPGRGNGFWGTGERDDCAGGSFAQSRHVAMDNAPYLGVVQPGTLQFADVNGDGLADMVEVRFNGVDVYLNDNGTRWTPRHELKNVPIKPNGTNPVRLADIDGSGTIDIVWGHGYDYKYVDLAGAVRPHVLVRAHNGLGKTTELEYSTSSQLMLDAAAAGKPWSRAMPLTVPVIVRSTVRDNLEKIGRPAGTYVTEYSYRDPVFEGRQREFRGFSEASTRTLGDANSPTSTTRSTFLLGECQIAQTGVDVCAPAGRWRDNWREPLKGLPVLVETFDETGVYLSTAHTTYELRQLYSGRDGRRVSAAFAVAQESFGYDTSNFTPASQVTLLNEVVVNLNGIAQTETRGVTKRGAGAVKINGQQVIDSFGNPTQMIARGCVEGCTAVDETITTHTDHERPPGDTSGWLFRPTETFVTGSVHTEPRNRVFFEYDARGDLVQSRARLSGTLPLDRFRDGGGAVAPAPPDASAGIAAPVDIVTMDYARDDFGNVTSTRAPPDRCRIVAFDLQYSELPVSETILAGDRGPNGCGTRALTTTAIYDRGFALLTNLFGITNQPTKLDYDGFGRITSKTFADPATPGQVAPLPTVTYEYFVPTNAGTAPYSSIVRRTQDGPSSGSVDYLEQRSYIDGLGRPLALLAEADPTAGDGGEWVVSAIIDFDKKGAPVRTYENFFWSGNASAYPLGAPAPSDFSSQQYDAFGRTIAAYGLDGQMKIQTQHHAMARDVWDAEDLSSGSHQGTFGTVESDGHGRLISSTERIRVSGVLEERQTLRDYLPTGEVVRIVQRKIGSTDTVRWMRYDSLGRLVLNAEPNTSTGFSPDPGTDPDGINAWRYAYNDAGDLVGTSDARGCGVNYRFEAAGRLVAEDYSPCELGHPTYTAVTDAATGAGAEAIYRYDVPDPETSSIVDAAGHALPVNAALLLGRVTAVSDRASKGVIRYDGRGRVTGTAVRIAQPTGADPANPGTYAPRWYIQDHSLDAANRTVHLSTGATISELLSPTGESATTASYTRRGLLRAIGSSYGQIVTSNTYAADARLTSAVFADHAITQRAYSYDQLRRLRSVQTYRASPQPWSSPTYTPPSDPTQQLLLEDYDFSYDEVGNIIEITDWRPPDDWPVGAKPSHRKFEYDDLYRLTRARYTHASGGDGWASPFAAENADPSRKPQPSPHVEFDERAKEQRYSYDHLGNTTRTTDDVHGFFDRSLGNVSNGTAAAGPHQVLTASNRALAPSSPSKGDLSAGYDEGGNLIALIIRRDGACLPATASCWQRFAYSWDELGRLADARRWDLTVGTERSNHGAIDDAPPDRPADVRLRYLYDASGARVLKTAVDPTGSESHTVFVFPTLELRRTTWATSAEIPDYVLNAQSESVVLPAGAARARIVYSEVDLPSQASGNQHVFLELGDHLGSTTFVIDLGTGELVEHSTYMAYGGADSDYRPERWDEFREPFKFSGKEEDVEVGLAYFGARYLAIGLGRWASPDPAAVHHFRSDPNPYAYVGGRPTIAVDPNGREAVTLGVIVGAVIVGALIGASVGAAAYTATHWGRFRWKEFAVAAGVGAVSGAVSGGVGAWAGSLTTSALAGAALGGTAGGAAGGSAAYGASLVGAELLGRDADPTWGGLGEAAGRGAVFGLASGLIGHGLNVIATPRPDPGTRVSLGEGRFASPEDAAKHAATQLHERTQATGQEYAGYIYRNSDGTYSLSDAVAGTQSKSGPFMYQNARDDVVAFWHTHPGEESAAAQLNEVNEAFSNQDQDLLEVVQIEEYEAALIAGREPRPITSYLATPRQNLTAQTISHDTLGARTFSDRTVGSFSTFRPAAAGGAISAGALDGVYRSSPQFRYLVSAVVWD